MKRLIITSLLAIFAFTFTQAKNITTTVTQVSQAVTLDTDVDYHISSATPFTDTGSINITNTEHAVVIFDALKPSLAKEFLSYIKINGAEAKDGTNCQLKLYDRGAIILPYAGSSFHPLTVFDGEDFTGESYNNLTEGHTGGFMKDMPDAWNNRIKSFKLKRGYMVTFALKKSGRGYSRCFIAANEDMEMTLPALMSNRVSSYRIFKWYDTSKVGVADYLDATALSKLNAQSSFTWSAGKSMLPDVEVVPHHIKENWPSPKDCGSVTYSPHLKTNNEPKNASDDSPCDLDDILANWEDLMRTGLRLCTPSSWDGSDYWNATGFLADFINAIDSRGWRVDIIDLHGYWNESSFTTNVNNWAQKFNRPVWISEWVWGASWSGGSGIFKEASSKDNPTQSDLNLNKTVVSRILDNLNKNNACERYFYWNGEANCSKILRDGNLTPAGEYFAKMKTNGPGYTDYGNYVPKAPPTNSVTDLAGSFTASTRKCKLTWTNQNGDLSKTIVLQRKMGNGKYENISILSGPDNEETTKMTVTDEVPLGEIITYRVVDTLYNKKALISNEYTLYSSLTTGTTDVQYGSSTSIPKDKGYVFFSQPFTEAPAVVFGSATLKNSPTSSNSVGIINNPLMITKQSDAYTYLTYQENLWTGTTASKAETSNFIVAKPGNGKIGDLNYEAGYVSQDGTSLTSANAGNFKGDMVEVTFQKPFADVPVVLISPIHSSTTLPVLMWRVFDVTKNGFKFLLQHESSETRAITARKVCYFAIDKGTGNDGNGNIYTVGDSELEFKSSNVALDYGVTLESPIMLTQLQTYNHQAGAILRIYSASSESARLRMQVDPSNTNMVLSSSRAANERVGYILISKEASGINSTMAQQPQKDDNIYDLSGRQIQRKSLRPGIYIISGKAVMVK